MKILQAAFLALLIAGFGSVASLASEAKSHWTYAGEEGPQHWGDLSAEYATCGTGHMQSPIDLADAEATGSVKLATDYKAVPLVVLNNGHTVQFNTEGGGTLTEAGIAYDLLQVHFHAPSEHVVKGKHAPLEAHFVHRSKDGTLSVIGVFIVEGKANPALATLIRYLPTKVTPATAVEGVTIDPNDLLPASMAMYRYMGSLTTPPCSEGVNWHVLSTSITASKGQIEALSAVLHMNARPVQPLNERLLVAPAE